MLIREIRGKIIFEDYFASLLYFYAFFAVSFFKRKGRKERQDSQRIISYLLFA